MSVVQNVSEYKRLLLHVKLGAHMPQNDSNEGPVGGNVPELAAPQGLTTKVEEYSLANPEASYQASCDSNRAACKYGSGIL